MTDSTLVRDLEEAREGSERLDWDILGQFGNPGYDINTCPPDMWRAVGGGQYRPLPFTTSLDAKLPWENIKDVRHNGWGWVAAHYDENGKRYEGEAHTEPLARRIAALKARAIKEPQTSMKDLYDAMGGSL